MKHAMTMRKRPCIAKPKQPPKRSRYLRGNNPIFFVPLPIDVIVSILAQNSRLLGMAHYLSKEIAIKARPLQMRLLAHKSFTHCEMSMCRGPLAMAETRAIDNVGTYRYYAFYFSESMTWKIHTGTEWGNHQRYYKLYRWFSPSNFLPTLVTHQPDLYTSCSLHQQRGHCRGEALKLVRETLEDRYSQKDTLGQVVSLHAFLLIHMVMLGKYREPHVIARLNGDMGAPWHDDPNSFALVKEIEEWYAEIKATL